MFHHILSSNTGKIHHLRDVSTGNEGPAFSGQDGCSYFRILINHGKSLIQLVQDFLAQGVQGLGTVYGNIGNMILDFVLQILKHDFLSFF